MFWNEELETIEENKLRNLQLKLLRDTIGRVYFNVPFYRDRFQQINLKPDDINFVQDINRLPFTTREDILNNYPTGLLAVPRDEMVRVHTSSGTTGKPKAIFFTKNDIDKAADLIARCLVMTGMRKNDVLQNMMTYGLFTGALVMHYGAEKVGVLIVPSGPGNTERQIMLMKDFHTTALHITPSYALYLADYIKTKGIEPAKDLYIKRAYLGAEPYSEETRKKIEEMLSIDVFNSYGLSEMNGPGVAFECEYKKGMHIWEDNFIVEIIDPDTGEVLQDGQKGEMVLTTLQREGMPLIRYRTRDITTIIPERCPCGRTHRRIDRIFGRSDDMFIVKGVNIFPQQIENVLMATKGVAQNYQIVLESLDNMIVKVEIAKDLFDGNVMHLVNLQNKIVESLKKEILVKPKVELLEPGALPFSEGKAKRVIDNRTL
ncbi:MAG TPA: phenylacetate--CoA ligase [Nitrospirae bacterium]|nr:phenylacetate--CoA ligase [Nitrospirota bacterium]